MLHAPLGTLLPLTHGSYVRYYVDAASLQRLISMFEVTGWSVGTVPVQDNDTMSSKKRKRSTMDNYQALEINLDKKLKSIAGDKERTNEERKKSRKNKRERQKTKVGSKSSSGTVLNISKPKPLKPRISADDKLVRPAKKARARESVSPSMTASILPSASSEPKLTALQQGMKRSLDGARFRSVICPVHAKGASWLSG